MQLLHSAKATLPDKASLKEFLRVLGSAIVRLKPSSAAELLQLSIEQRRVSKKEQRLTPAGTAFPNAPAEAVHEICKPKVAKGPITAQMKGPQSIMYLTPQELEIASRPGGDWMGRYVYCTADSVDKCDMKMTAGLVRAMCASLHEPVPPNVISAPANEEVLVTIRCAVFDASYSTPPKMSRKCSSTASTSGSTAGPAAKQKPPAEYRATADVLHQGASKTCSVPGKPSATVLPTSLHQSGHVPQKQLSAAVATASERTCCMSCKQPSFATAQGHMQSGATSSTGTYSTGRASVQLPYKLDGRLLDELKAQWDQAVEWTKQAEARTYKAEVDMKQHRDVTGKAVGLAHLRAAKQQLLQAQHNEKHAEVILQAASLKIIAAQPADSASEEIRIAQALLQEDNVWDDAVQDYRMAALDAIMARLENSRHTAIENSILRAAYGEQQAAICKIH